MKLSILDQSPIAKGKTAQDALHASIELANLADSLGYTRYWIAEHHDMSGLACPNPDAMLARIGASTRNIRLGAGAVLLPHYRPFQVAERYNLLGTLYRDRIDLGIGRAPGGSAEASIALSGNFLENVRKVPEKLDELLKFLNNDFEEGETYAEIQPTPVPSVSPKLWMLGTSEKSALAAAEKGIPYVFGQFMSEEDGSVITQTYTENFKKQYPNRTPETIVTVAVICAETTEEAQDLALSNQLWSIQGNKGEADGKIPSVQEAKAYNYTEDDQKIIQTMVDRTIIGNPQEVRQQLNKLQSIYQADELMIVTITHSYKAREKSYKLIAEEML